MDEKLIIKMDLNAIVVINKDETEPLLYGCD